MSRAGGLSHPLALTEAFSKHSTGSPSGPRATLGSGHPVVAETQPMIKKMISATDKCRDGNETGG